MSSCDHSRINRGNFSILKDAYLIMYMKYKTMDVTLNTEGVSFKAWEINCNSVILRMEFRARQDDSNQSYVCTDKDTNFYQSCFSYKIYSVNIAYISVENTLG
jgi:hypothetical protein